MEPLYPWEYLFSSLIRDRGREVPRVPPVEEEVGSGSAAGTSPFWLAVGLHCVDLLTTGTEQ